ncbi:peptidylprolyl isomerase [Labilibacter sediminis]|nr:peptidylprolyl isomerase [Labilibacter sediminis]
MKPLRNLRLNFLYSSINMLTMNYNKYSLVFICTILMFVVGCKMQSSEKQQKRNITSEDLISANRYLVEKDAAIIKEYIERNELQMKETKTGLWYQIIEKGEGALAKKGDVVKIAYDVSLLDGEMCYSSDSLGLKSFLIGQGGVESGLEEGILLLRKGSKATFIMPPHRAYGLVGDDDKIPGRSILVYTVEVKELEKK